MKLKATKIVNIGPVYVDSGMLMLCDPGAVLATSDPKMSPSKAKKIYSTESPNFWSEFVDRLAKSTLGKDSWLWINPFYPQNIGGEVALIATGMGDGAYDVELKMGDFGMFEGKDWKVMSATITFLNDDGTPAIN